MKQVTYQGFIQDAFTITRTSKNTYRIVRYDNVHHVVHSQSEVFDFMEQQGIHSFEIVDIRTVISD